ncbi:hypothetical protein ABL78_5284 [Leptomonas seymouri]|uniref:Uncharacterized protein n=1 Tax=Leptomonas seymouri TaxID=5684 RepID=A0A0N1I2D8_LEPSE|nr:hypothetical protein ABL78_5284 [Leptomonas seymouri]|eukprot:KPI85663.1 hypothetical protein ABL78_5284 [Leptomonas seymouri]
MVRTSPGKAKAASSGVPQLYDETISGPCSVVDVGNPTAWANTISGAVSPTAADGAVKYSSEKGVAVTARWGHAVELSPNESVLCIIAGRPCSHATAAAEATAFDLVAWTPTLNVRSAKAAHVWQSIPYQPSSASADTTSAPPETASTHEMLTAARWPHYAPWWLTWEMRPHEGERPVGAWVDGGWAAGHRLADTQLFVPISYGDNKQPHQPTPTHSISRSHHSVTLVQGVRFRFGGETQAGTVTALDTIDEASVVPPAVTDSSHNTPGERCATAAGEAPVDLNAAPRRLDSPAAPSSVNAAASPQQQQPKAPPPRAAHSACCLCQRFLVVFGGRRVNWQDDGTDATRGPSPSGREGRGAGNGLGKGASTGKAASRATSVNRRGAPGGKGTDNHNHSSGADAVSTAVLTVHKDVAVYDTRLKLWLPVHIAGGPGPCARYAAAVAAVPTPASSSSGNLVNHREVLVVGGLDAGGQVCSDAWLLQILSGAESELAEMPSSARKESKAAHANTPALPVVTARWVRLNLPSGLTSTALPNSDRSSPVSVNSLSSPTALSTVFARHHAAAVVSSQRIAYVVGGCGQGGHSEVAAQPSVYTLSLPHLTSTTVRVEEAANADGAAAEGAGLPSLNGSAGSFTPPSNAKKTM